MNIYGVIAEFNPLHEGHAALLQIMRSHGAEYIAVVMSGNFVQRGEPALLPKQYRVRAALLAGADLVIELPLPWAMSSAEHFARGGVFLLNAIGCGEIWFGSECGDASLLMKTAEMLDAPEVVSALRDMIKKGMSFASAREEALRMICGPSFSSLLKMPNNILGIEYCRAIRFLESTIHPVSIPRIGAGHHDVAPIDGTASASTLRQWVRQERASENIFWSRYMPEPSFELLQEALQKGQAPACMRRLERAVLASLRCMKRSQIKELPDISEGLENRIFREIQTADSLDSLMNAIKTKRYSHARIRRILMSAFLGLKEQDGEGTPPYLRVLGMSSKGEVLLRNQSPFIAMPRILSAKDRLHLDSKGNTVFELESRSSDLYALSLPVPFACGSEYRYSLEKNLF